MTPDRHRGNSKFTKGDAGKSRKYCDVLAYGIFAEWAVSNEIQEILGKGVISQNLNGSLFCDVVSGGLVIRSTQIFTSATNVAAAGLAG